MASFLAGQRLQAAQINALTALSAQISGGPTSSTTELLLTGTLSIPAAPIDRLVVPSFILIASNSVAGDHFIIRVRDTNLSGTERLVVRRNMATTVPEDYSASGAAFQLAANTALTLVASLQRSTGTGTLSIAGSGVTRNSITAHLATVT